MNVNPEVAAEKVLELDPRCVKGVFIKAEALYYTCNFERAMVMYFQGMVRSAANSK